MVRASRMSMRPPGALLLSTNRRGGRVASASQGPMRKPNAAHSAGGRAAQHPVVGSERTDLVQGVWIGGDDPAGQPIDDEQAAPRHRDGPRLRRRGGRGGAQRRRRRERAGREIDGVDAPVAIGADDDTIHPPRVRGTGIVVARHARHGRALMRGGQAGASDGGKRRPSARRRAAACRAGRNRAGQAKG